MPQLKIFISHKMPTDTEVASEIGNMLALYGASLVRVVHAGDFRYGDNWRENIEKELSEADWLLYLFTDQDEDWGFCLFECGFFRSTMMSNPNKQLITLAREPDQINDALKEFNAVPMTDEAVFDLLKQIYRQEPWQINPGLPDEVLRTTAHKIFMIFGDIHTITEQRDVIPSITIEFDEANRPSLESDVMPAGATVSGAKQWQVLFGKDSDTGGWLWEDLTKDWAYRYVYEFLFARMMRDALASRIPKGCMLRTSKNNGLYRVSLRRYQRQTNKKYVFYFNASPFDLPFSIPEDETKKKETVLFHLVNLSWYFRRRIIDNLYIELLQIQSTKGSPSYATNAKNLFEELSRELMDIEAQSIIRGIDNRYVVQEALGNDPAVVNLLDRVQQWYVLRDEMFKNMASGVVNIDAVAKTLSQFAQLNYEFYIVTANAYAEASKNLEKPKLPP